MEIDESMSMVAQETETNEEEIQKLKGMEKSLGILGDPCRKILELYYYHKKNMKEIADVAGLKNPETAKNMKYKCLKRLRTICQNEVV